MADVQYTPQWREYAYQEPEPVTPSYQQPVPAGAPVLPMTPGYAIKPEALRQFDLRTAPDRLQAYCDALDRRVEVLEQGMVALLAATNTMQKAITVLLDREIEQVGIVGRVETLEAEVAALRQRLHRLELIEVAE